jgi:diaminopimelate epimerase
MILNFSKYSAAGNDFILIDDWAAQLSLGTDQIVRLCHRRFGIGADGVLVLRPAETADFQMNYYNADGSRGEMCGNGARSIVHFAHHLAHAGVKGTFDADDGIHHFVINDQGIQVEIRVPGTLQDWNLPGPGCGQINTGVPHLVVPDEHIMELDLDSLGQRMNAHSEHPEGTNVNVISRRGDRQIQIRTWERGVNQETLACGTGATAAAIFVHEKWKDPWPIELVFQGGTLSVDKTGNQYWLGGPVELVFAGQAVLA